MNIIESFMNSIAREMTPPNAYGTVHIILIVVGLTACISLAYLCRNLGERGNKILLLSFAGVLILSEIFKQLFLYYVLCDSSICWGELPFQMCSLPMYLCPIAVFAKSERVKRAAYGFMMCFNLLGGFAGMFEPSGIFLKQVPLTIHAVAWHVSLVFLGLYIMFSGRAGRDPKEFGDVVKTFLVCCFIAFVINTLVGITVGDKINMFFVGPNNSPIIVFNTISKKFGWVASTVIYIPVTIIAAGAVYWLSCKVRDLRERRKGKN
jgi:uncharacterized membrane protein YwaF